jgi:hypothetical protein
MQKYPLLRFIRQYLYQALALTTTARPAFNTINNNQDKTPKQPELLAKKTLLLILLLMSALPIVAQTQNTYIGQWQMMQCYKSAQTIAKAENLIYVGTSGALFSYDTQSSELKTITKIDGLNDINIKHLVYDPATQQLIIIYANNNIDIYKNEKIVNIKDLQNADIGAAIVVNSAILNNNLVYLSTNVGIVVFDPQALEIKDTYIIGSNGERVTVYQTDINNNQIVAATAQGLLKANLSDNLWNYQNWQPDPQLPPNQTVWHAAYFNGTLYAEIQDNKIFKQEANGTWNLVYDAENYTIRTLRVSNGQLFIITHNPDAQGRIAVISSDLSLSYIGHWYLPQPIDMVGNGQGTYWIADLWESMQEWKSDYSYQNIVPTTPRSANALRLYYRENELWVAPGTINNNFDGGINGSLGSNLEGIWQFNNNQWKSWNWNNDTQKPFMPNIVTMTFHPTDKNKVYWGALDEQGLFEFDYTQNILNDLSPDLRPLQNFNDDDGIRISDLETDSQNNLWMSSLFTPNPIMLKKSDGTYKSFKFSTIPSGESNRFTHVEVDNYGLIWTLINASGVVVFNPENTINGNNAVNTVSAADYRHFKSGEETGGLSGTRFYAIAKDRDGAVWVGSDDGITVFTCSGSDLTYCSGRKPVLVQDGLGAYLLQNERVNCIAVDAANRKWVGTANGLWLFSPDGLKTIHHFNIENSPLLSNYITHLAIDHQSGTVYIATEKGILSYKSDAIAGEVGHGEVVVYPNPVRPDYAGDIAIKGLPVDATVKITDIAGNLVYETTSLGGQAIWNGRDYKGRLAASGVYLVFSSDPTNVQHQVNKITIVR